MTEEEMLEAMSVAIKDAIARSSAKAAARIDELETAVNSYRVALAMALSRRQMEEDEPTFAPPDEGVPDATWVATFERDVRRLTTKLMLTSSEGQQWAARVNREASGLIQSVTVEPKEARQ